MTVTVPAPDQQSPDCPLPVRYMPQLDALRALAVLAVWFEHWGKQSVPGMRRIDWGLLGVRLFFVLSGFLITGILLRARDGAADGRAGLWHAARNFYARRFLRILPIYYLALFVATAVARKGVVNLPGMRALFPWHLTYTTNVYAALFGYPWGAGMHFWSLAVEEQFYLFWPWVILLVPRRHLLKTVWAAVALAILFRAACAAAGRTGTVGMLPPGCLDQFALGAALAVLGHDPRHVALWRRFTRACLWIGLPAMGLTLALSAARRADGLTFVASGLAAAGVFAWLIGGAARGFGGPAGAVLESRPLLFLGRISYGLYVYHPFVAVGVAALAEKVGRPLPGALGVRFLVFAAATVAVSTASWYAVERPLQNFKRFFQYVPSTAGRRDLPDALAPAAR